MATTLGTYKTSTFRLLRDNQTLYPAGDIAAFINEARHVRDLDTRLVRKVFGFTLVPNQSTYTFTTLAAGAAAIRGETFTNFREVVSLYVLPMGGVAGGIGIRYPVGRQPYSIGASMVSTSWPSYPKIFASIGHSTIVLGPPPAAAYPSEWDVLGVYPDLVNDGDPEPMPDPYNDAVPYLAAAIAKDNAQRFDEADAFKAQYEERMRRIGIGIHSTSIPNPGFDTPRRYR
jgi:hypothetical protein